MLTLAACSSPPSPSKAGSISSTSPSPSKTPVPSPVISSATQAPVIKALLTLSATPEITPSFTPTRVPNGVFALQLNSPLILKYDPATWKDISIYGNPNRINNSLQANYLRTCSFGVGGNIEFNIHPLPVIIWLGTLEYTKMVWPADPSGYRTASFWMQQPLPGYDQNQGWPNIGVRASQDEWTQCMALSERVLSTLQVPGGSLTSTPAPPPRWRQYEITLASAMLGQDTYPSRTLGNGLCEWEIYGHTQYRVYLNATCQDASSAEGTAGDTPAVIHLLEDGSIDDVVLPKDGSGFLPSIQAMFPPDLQAKVTPGRQAFTYDGPAAMAHIAFRRSHPGTPPKIVDDGAPLP
jgi:hypothetical protein